MGFGLEQERIVGGIGADDGFWEALSEGELRLPRCAGCGGWMWPAHFRCGKCGSWESTWTSVEPAGTIYTWTRTWYAFDRVRERASDVPYVTVVAELPQAGGARVMGLLVGEEDGLRVGAKLRGKIMPASEKSKGYPSICWTIESDGHR